MAHSGNNNNNNNNNSGGNHFNSYPAWPQMTPAPTSAQHAAMPYTPLQQMSAPQGAPPPPLLTPTVHLPPELQNLNLTPQQLAAMFTFFRAQSSAAPLPPPPPPPPPPPFTAAPAPAPQSTYLTPSFPRSAAGNVALQEIDREDGELSDAEQVTVKPRPSSRLKKRKLNASPHQNRLVSQRSAQYDDMQANGHGHPRPGSGHEAHEPLAQHGPAQSDNKVHKSGDEKSMVLSFVAAMHAEGFSYDDLAREGLDPSLLRATYAELQIPISPKESEQKGSPAGLPGLVTNSSQGSLANPSILPNVPTTEAAKSPGATTSNGAAAAPLAPAAPADRQSYLARLQAAKVKKGSSSVPKPAALPAKPAHVPVPAPAPAPAASPVVVPVVKPAAITTITSRPVSSQDTAPPKPQATQKTSDAATELVRKKMEALKSLKRRMAPRPPAAVQTPPSDASPVVPQSIVTADPGREAPRDVLLQTPEMVAIVPPIQTPTVPSPGLSSTGGIPGLFMSTVTSKPAHNTSTSQVNSSSLQSDAPQSSNDASTSEQTLPASRQTSTSRRRPVAADLNEVNVEMEAPRYKRPFGQSRQNSSDDAMIIEVSDDEDGPGEDVQAVMASNASIRQKSIRDLPPLRDFPHRTAASKPGTLPGTPTPLGTPGTSSDVEELKRKEKEINALQLRIQEFERRKTALKKGQMVGSRPESPSAAPRTVPPPPSFMAAQANRSLPGLTMGQLPGLEKKVDVTSERQTKLKADISASDAALNARRTQMMELQRQMAELQKQCDDEERNKQELREQLESLDIDTEGMTHQEMQAKKDEIDKHMQGVRIEGAVDDVAVDAANLPNNDGSIIKESASTTASDATAHNALQKSASEEFQISARIDPASATGSSTLANPPEKSDVNSQATTVDDNNVLVSGSQAATIATSQMLNKEEQQKQDDDDDEDDEGSSMSESTDSEDDEGHIEGLATTTSLLSPAEASSSDVEMDTSESSSDESDSDHQSGNNQDDEILADAKPTMASDVSSSLESNAPAEEVGVAETSVDDEELEDTDMDLDSSESDEVSDYEPAAATDVPTTSGLAQTVKPSDHVTNEYVADDLAPELQANKEQEAVLDAWQNGTTAVQPQYIPYESSLKKFKKYRFHPDYLQNVTGGYHSLTYSHRINPHVPLCRFEFYGGDCRDQSCDGQHWRDLALSDDQLLIQLGTNQANPGRTKEEIARYNIGLKKIIQELRQEDTSDTEIVGARIASYRRQFIGDPTVVVTQ